MEDAFSVPFILSWFYFNDLALSLNMKPRLRGNSEMAHCVVLTDRCHAAVILSQEI